ncbi:vomeronasal type-2 receptor 26-like [Antechinus flavipes]|uniref:vomeronasal type-2 receptor 26-like n=1 Tax=Antechinus flavipes TaxID=38775 RepID=UPI002236AD4C|nr:vomeronasal type-2 receptor 26-like [Antechinus flavipes]
MQGHIPLNSNQSFNAEEVERLLMLQPSQLLEAGTEEGLFPTSHDPSLYRSPGSDLRSHWRKQRDISQVHVQDKDNGNDFPGAASPVIPAPKTEGNRDSRGLRAARIRTPDPCIDGNNIPSAVCNPSCPAGFRKLPLEGKPPCCFSCSPCSEGEMSSHMDAEQCKKCPEDEYPNKQRDRCLPKSVTFLDVNETWGMAVTLVAVSLSLLTALVLWVFVKFQDTPIVQANNRNFSYLLLTSLSSCFLCSLLFVGRPTTASCLLRQTVFAVVFTVAVSSILAKTIIVVLAFRVTGPGSRMRMFLHPRVPYCVVLICSGIQGLSCAIWLGTHPPFPEADISSESRHIILTCNEGSAFAFYCVLGYMGFLALGSFTIAFLASNLPDAFNEAKFITFSMLVFCSVWVSFLPTYQSSKGKAVMIVEIFSILASSAGLLGCIFIPKCLVILLISWENNTKQSKNQRSSRSKNSFFF